jgi:hypothetical protein
VYPTDAEEPSSKSPPPATADSLLLLLLTPPTPPIHPSLSPNSPITQFLLSGCWVGYWLLVL